MRNLFASALHGATFAKAKKLRASMSKEKLREFASTSTKHLPQHVSNRYPR
jgi:hypothetical protein